MIDGLSIVFYCYLVYQINIYETASKHLDKDSDKPNGWRHNNRNRIPFNG